MFQVPKRSSAGSYLLKALLVIAIVIFLGKRMPLWLARSRSSGYSQIHPIEQLHEQHLDHFVRKLQNQSKTLQAANREYERRNGRVPPEGFDAWFNLAKSHSFVFIDEFDGIMHAIQALWDIPSSILRSRLEYARYERAQGLAFFEVNSGKVDFLGSSGSGDLERALLRHLERISGMGWTLPDVTFFLNTLDEPRVFAHEQDVARSLSNVTTWQSYEPYSATAELQKTCSQSQSSSLSGNTQDYRSLSFTSNTIESADYCRHSDLFQQHGFLQAPETFILTRDIMQDAASGLNPDLEPPWEHKEDVLYWSGSSTGMHATTENWRTGHRQRLATDLALNSSGHRNVTLLELGDYGWTPQSVGFARLSHLFDVSIRGIVQCDEPAYAAMSAAFPSSVNDPASKAFEHKFVLDIDGNTWSGRYHRLLRSRSCVFKMTIFREAQDAHLEPWVHYVPISMAATELAEMMNFFTANPNGQRISRDIAEAGRYAAMNYLREIDADIITLRILLELGRVLKD